MFKNSSKIMFLSILMLGSMISISANTWIGAWMGLEINLLAFIPIMNIYQNALTTESALKYFLTQAIASTILLFSILIYSFKISVFSQMKMEMINIIMMMSLFLKVGMTPFHFWFPSVMEGLTWMNSLILMTWQKIAPFILMSYLIIKPLMLATIIASAIVGALGGLNQTSLRKLMAFSSINHMSWMASSLMSSEQLWMFYFMVYSLINMSLIFMFNFKKLLYINQIFSMNFSSQTIKFLLFLNLLSLGGLPPFSGFLSKWMVIQFLMSTQQYIILFIMIMTSLITLFFYIRTSFSAFTFNNYQNNWLMTTNYNNLSMYLCMILSSMTLMCSPIINFMFFNF
uniref:NADH-ubiquinone oxidoreductase chain 2 n=1 Tax=Geron pallipilosus TaxID=2682726 RepID=A0A6B9PH57_9MUSC|nr:NADH dehydrogenase subunit 2 [Geron pallipilosus]